MKSFYDVRRTLDEDEAGEAMVASMKGEGGNELNALVGSRQGELRKTKQKFRRRCRGSNDGRSLWLVGDGRRRENETRAGG